MAEVKKTYMKSFYDLHKAIKQANNNIVTRCNPIILALTLSACSRGYSTLWTIKEAKICPTMPLPDKPFAFYAPFDKKQHRALH
jgi:hypothetical protein